MKSESSRERFKISDLTGLSVSFLSELKIAKDGVARKFNPGCSVAVIELIMEPRS